MRQESPQPTMLGAGVCPRTLEAQAPAAPSARTRVRTHGPTRRLTPRQGRCSGPSSSATHTHHAGRSPGTGSLPPNHQGNGGSSITGPGCGFQPCPRASSPETGSEQDRNHRTYG